MKNALVRTVLASFAIVCPLGAQAQEPLSIRVSHPSAGQMLSTRTFPLLYVLEGDIDSSNLDHVHWQLNDGDKPTAPDLSGVDEITVEADGEYRLTVWMADKDHGVIGEKAILTFEVVTFGAQVLSPTAGGRVESSNVEIYYTLFGTQPAGASGVAVRIDDGAPELDTDGDGAVHFSGIANGPHTVRIYIADSGGSPLSKTFESQLSVESDLTIGNLAEAKRLARAATSSRSYRTKRKALSKLRQLLSRMERGGDYAAGAPALDNRSVARARLMTGGVLAGRSSVGPLMRFLRSLERKAKKGA